MDSSEPIKIPLQPRASLFKTQGQLGGVAYLPIEATEQVDAVYSLLILAMMALLIWVFFPIHRGDFAGQAVGLVLCTYILLRAISIARKTILARQFGPNRIRVSEEGLFVSNRTSGTMPWSDVLAVYPKFAHGKILGIDLKLRSKKYLLDGGNESEIPDPREIAFLSVELDDYPNQNALGEAIIAAANHFCENRSAWAGLPPGSFS